jgi:hypothetical protein
MASSIERSPHLAAAALAIAVCALALSACNGPGSAPVSPAVSPQGSHLAKHLDSTPPPSPIPFDFQTVDNPDSNVNEVTAINQRSKIVGVYMSGYGSNIPRSYTSEPVYYTKFRGVNAPNTQGTFATSTSTDRVLAGYVIDPNGQSGIWAFVRVKALWSLFQYQLQTTEILGLNDSENAVGFYVNSSGIDVPFELNVPQNQYTILSPPGSTGNAEATGINGKGGITGWEQTSNGIAGWFLQNGTYYTVSNNGLDTYALGLNWSNEIVGYYTGTDGLSHGFILFGPTKGGAEQFWQTIDEPKAVYGTVVTGINNHHDICGYYFDASHVQHGFVAKPKS